MNEEQLKKQTQEIEQLLANAKISIAELNEIKSQATQARSTIKSRETESSNRCSEIDGLKAKANQIVTQINTSVQSVSEKITEIQVYYPKFIELKTKVENEETGLDALYTQVLDFRDDAVKVKKAADDQLIEIKGRLKDVDAIKIQTQDRKGEIDKLVGDSQSLRDSISQHLELIDPSVLRHEFKKREKTLIWFVGIWGTVAIISLIGFGVSILFVFNKLAVNGFSGWHDWYRILFTTPLLILVAWASKNYGEERKLLERYAFKAVISTSLTSYIKLLSDRFKDAHDEILAFTSEALRKLYKEPYEEIDVKKRGNISLWNIFKAEVELDEKVKNEVDKAVQKKVEKEVENLL